MSTVSNRSESDLRVDSYQSLCGAGLDVRARIEEICFLSANWQAFPSEAARQDFLHRWTSYYLTEEPAWTLVGRNGDGEVIGYLTGCKDSQAAEVLYQSIPGYALFEDLFSEFPAHFHINCHPDHRCRGYGSRLLAHLVALCQDAGLAGIHLVTLQGRRNVAFYRRNGFTEEFEREDEGRPYLFLGRRLG